MDVVWLKRDVRLHDHGPLAAASRSDRPCVVLYLYEPDQLREPTVHGSHVAVINEGLLDLEQQLNNNKGAATTTKAVFTKLTICHAGAVETLEALHHGPQNDDNISSDSDSQLIKQGQQGRIARLLAHQETGHMASYQRDRAVRRWCRENKVEFGEFRQKGGETQGLAVLHSFLTQRVTGYSSGISSPNSAWNSCSRLSVYLAWGHVSLRRVIHQVRARQAKLKASSSLGLAGERRSLSAFVSRLHWRSHFIQKLESDPHMELRDMCPSYQHLRRGPQDFCQAHYEAWAAGRTGFPLVDACMRCLHKHGWLNFRMRAMIVSFATYNLWLDWHCIAPHLARLFLDYEPGIHYPQLQMQSGTTGINAMRVYNVTKQGKEQDPDGVFIRRFVPELKHVPTDYIHSPWKMPVSYQEKAGCIIGKHYPDAIVNEAESARQAKSKVAAVRNKDTTKDMAKQVYLKHGSRNPRRDEMNKFPKRPKREPGQSSIQSFVSTKAATASTGKIVNVYTRTDNASEDSKKIATPKTVMHWCKSGASTPTGSFIVCNKRKQSIVQTKSWSCSKCTFLNSKPHALVCEVCASARNS